MRYIIIGVIGCVFGFGLGVLCTGLRGSSENVKGTVTVEKREEGWSEVKGLTVKDRGGLVQAHQEFRSDYHGNVLFDVEIPKTMFEKRHGIGMGLGYYDKSILATVTYWYKSVSVMGIMGFPLVRDRGYQGGVMVTVTILRW